MYRIFIVEDDSTMAAVMKKQIESWGHSVHVATQFSDILSEFTAYDPHMVLMDVMLPFFNGYHWCSEIRKISNVPVMFISSVSDNMNIVMAMNMGGDDFIAKPVDLTVILICSPTTDIFCSNFRGNLVPIVFFAMLTHHIIYKDTTFYLFNDTLHIKNRIKAI